MTSTSSNHSEPQAIERVAELQESLLRAIYENRTPVIERLLKSRADASASDPSGQTPLHWAARTGHDEAARILTDWHASPIACSRDGSTPLHLAAEADSAALVRLLLMRRADPSAKTKSRRTPLHCAADLGSCNAAATLFELAPKEASLALSSVDHRGDVPLLLAASRGHAKVVRLLLAARADPQCRNRKGEGVLQLAVGKGRSEVVAALLEGGDYADTLRESGVSLLLDLVLRGDASTAEVLIAHGVDVGTRDENGYTALHVAAEKNRPEVISLLLRLGADANSRDNYAQTPLFLAGAAGHVAAVRALLAGGANPWAVDSIGQTSLHAAVIEGHDEVARVLVANSANVDALDAEGRTPVVLAVAHGRHNAVLALLQCGASLPPEVEKTPRLLSILEEVSLKSQADEPVVLASQLEKTNCSASLVRSIRLNHERPITDDSKEVAVETGIAQLDSISENSTCRDKDQADLDSHERASVETSPLRTATSLQTSGESHCMKGRSGLQMELGEGPNQESDEVQVPSCQTLADDLSARLHGAGRLGSLPSLNDMAETLDSQKRDLDDMRRLILLSKSEVQTSQCQSSTDDLTASLHEASRVGSFPEIAENSFPEIAENLDSQERDLDDMRTSLPSLAEGQVLDTNSLAENSSYLFQDQPVSRKREDIEEPFLELMRSQGDGNISVAWRRYFDVNGDSEVSFQDFCGGLATIGYHDDALKLWQSLDLQSSNHLALRCVDADGAKTIAEFGQWCSRSHGGPIEVFAAINVAGEIYLTSEDLLSGLRRLGFFNEKDLSEHLNCEENFLRHMYPLIDPWGKGMVSEDKLLFLERDGPKKRRLIRKFARANRYLLQEESSRSCAASNLLSDLSKRSKWAAKNGLNVDRYLEPVPEQLSVPIQQHREKQKVRTRRNAPRSASTPDLAHNPPPAGVDAANAAAKVMAEVTKGGKMPQSLSLPRLPTVGVRRPAHSGTGSCNGGSETTSCRTSIAASSVAATRQGMKRLYKRCLVDQLPTVNTNHHHDGRYARGMAMPGIGNHQSQVDLALNPQRCEEFLSHLSEKKLFEQYYKYAA